MENDENINENVEYFDNENGKTKVTIYEKKEEQKRVFKGVWIPKEVWLDSDLNILEKCLLAEIDSLDGKHGCFASNSYFAKFFNIKEQNISRHLSKLKKLGYIKQIYFDGRKRILKCDLMKSLRQDNQEHEGSLNENNVQYNIDYNKEYVLSKDNKKSSKELIKKDNPIKKIKPKLPFNKAKDITKKCLNIFYNNKIFLKPKTNKNAFYSEDKIYKCEEIINYFINGFPLTMHNDLRLFINKNDFNFDMDKGFKTEEIFYDYFLVAMNIFNIEYAPKDKNILPNHLLDFLYDSFKNFKSYFLFYAFNPVKKIELEKIRKDKHPEISNIYKQIFINKNDNELNDFIKKINDLYNKYENIMNKKINYNNKIYLRKDIEDDNFRTYMNSFKLFVSHLHYDFIKDIDNIHLGWLSVNNQCWDIFCGWVKKNYNIDFNEIDKSIISRCKHNIKK